MTDTIEIKKDTLWKASTLVLLLVVVGMLIPWGESEAGINGNAVKGGSNDGGQKVLDIKMDDLVDDDAFKGDKDAPVTIVEWSDYECPFCTRFYSQTLGLIDKEYIQTGKVKFVYRDFPLGFHKNAQKAAEAAECAGEQGKYFEMHDLLFESGVEGGVTAFKQYAETIGLDKDEFNSCLDSGEMANEVQEDMQDGQAVGVSGTPGFIINGKLVSGAQPFSVFQQAIEAELA